MFKSAIKFFIVSLLPIAVAVFFSQCKKDEAFADSTENIETLAENQATPSPEDLPEQAGGRQCNTAEVVKQSLAAHPEFVLERRRLEAFTQKFVDAGGAKDRTVVTIPVVFRVLYNNAAENVSDAQLLSQLPVLNADFRRLNADAANTPAVFQGVAADSEIEFCLAQQDPNGNPTTGITRNYTTVTKFTSSAGPFHTSSGGVTIWDPSKYLNIYVADISGLGYTWYPGSAPAGQDGVAIDYLAIGVGGSAAAPYDKGRTATHEVGHWLNLTHIWGEDDDNPTCSDSDHVGDTPNQSFKHFGCPSFPQLSCNNGPNGDMFMNYMDYPNDDCMNLFTTGQKNRMQANFAPGGYRASLLTSPACTPPGGGGGCGIPSGLASSNVATTTATVSWAAVSGAASYTLQYKASSASTWTTVSNIAPTSHNLTGLTASTPYQFKVKTVCSGSSSVYSAVATFTTQSNSCTDIYEANNTKATAKSLTPNTTITAKIGTSTDVDWFKFVNTSAQSNIKITLTNVPADYDVFLYRGSTLLASSENPDTESEEIVYNTNTVATYFIKVVGYNGAFNNSICYSLSPQTSGATFNLAAPITNIFSTSGKVKITQH